MEYKKQIHGEEEEEEEEDEDDDEEGELPSSTSLGFNPLSSPFALRGSAFSRPILSPSSSLISSRGRGGGAAAKNVSLFGGSADPAAEKAAAAAGNPKDATSGGGGGVNRYRECLRNHAAASGGHVLDGCGEFMPAEGEEALKCAACGCHRSFHRKESKDAAVEAYYRGATSAPLPLLLAPPPHHQHQHQKQFQFGAPVTPSSGGAGGTTTESSSEERINAGVRPPTAQRKRFRTKFTAEQKEKMQAFAERIGWRIQKHDEAAAERFFEEAGVSRHVFKVWMHNNKHLIKRPQQQQQQQQQQQEEEEDDREQQQLKLPQEQQHQQQERSHSDRSP